MVKQLINMATPSLAHMGLLWPGLQGIPYQSSTSRVLPACPRWSGASLGPQLPSAVPQDKPGPGADRGAGRAHCGLNQRPKRVSSCPFASTLPLPSPATAVGLAEGCMQVLPATEAAAT